MIINGYGNYQGILFGAGVDEIKYLDIYDQDQLSKAEIDSCLVEQARIVLSSCETGQEGIDQYNIANVLQSVFKTAVVFAPRVSIAMEELFFDETGKLANVIFYQNENNTYCTKLEF